MTDITRLDDATISQIAAGEVIERPASVVKELVENSLDAGADRIDVTVSGDGTDLIRVADDGEGMTEEGVRRAVEQHTTSKIGSIDDLERGVGTLGFRGEALHTIGAVSRMTIETRQREGADVGWEVRVEGGELTDLAPVGRAPGTTVTVADLFYNTPARRKYLKRVATEFGHVNRVVSRYALANPSIAISLTHDDHEVFATAGSGDLQEAVLAVYGREVAENMIQVEGSPGGAVTAISGLVSDPETNRSGAEYVSTYVNGRYVRSDAIRSAILEAYGKQLAGDRYPFAVLFVTVPSDAVDVNVHPRKMAVRFDDEVAVTDAVTDAVREALLDHGLIRSGAPRGRSAPDETTVEPAPTDAKPAQTNAEPAPSDAEPVPTDAETDQSEAESSSGTDRSTAPDQSTRPDPSTATDPSTPADQSKRAAEPADPNSGNESRTTPDEHPETPQAPPTDRSRSAIPDRPDVDIDPLQTDLSADAAAATADFETETLPPLRIIGQIHDTYVVAESPDGLVLIDQHAADERVNYERLQEELGDRTGTQRLVEPVELSVTPQEARQFEAVDTLETWGFEARLEDDHLVVTGVPAVFEANVSPDLLRDVLGSTLEAGEDKTVRSAADELLADMACYPSITGNTPLRDGDIVELLEALDGCENPYACPHGRPTIIELGIDELEDRFERDYPGHDHRRP